MTARPSQPWRERRRRRLTLRAVDRRGSHAWARRLLAQRMDAPPDADEALWLADHLLGCARCRSVARAHEEARRDLRAMRPTVVPRDLGARVSAALDREMGDARLGPLRMPDGLGRVGRSWIPPVVAGAAAVAILVSGARLLLAPGAPPALLGDDDAGTAAVRPLDDGRLGAPAAQPRPTPLAVAMAQLALVDQGSDGLTVYRTAVSEVCPDAVMDCTATRPLAAAVVSIGTDLVPRGVALDDERGRMALLAEDTVGADSVSVVTLPPAVGPSDPARVSVIIEGVEVVGAPPAWSPDGVMLAFSAMPIDHARGPDVYLWRPGDARARRLTADHRSWFASWSGARIVLSRMARGEGRERADTVLLDPDRATETVAPIRGAWLPSVDPSGRFAVAWRGTLTGGLAEVRPRTGGLALIDWTLVDARAARDADGPRPLALRRPGRTASQGVRPRAVSNRTRDGQAAATGGGRAGSGRAGGDPEGGGRAGDHPTRDRDASPWLEVIEASTGDGPAALDWQVRWADTDTTFGYWVADAHGASWGRLTVLRVDPATHQVDRGAVLLGPTLARRSFTLGDERIAWVAPAEEGAEGELRVRVWGVPGEGSLRIRDIHLRDGIPAF